jgi:hypothetical protein
MTIRFWPVFGKRILLVALILTAWIVVISARPLAGVATAQEPDTVITIDTTLEELGVARFGGSMSWEEETPFLGERESWHLKKFAALVDEDGEFNLHIEFDLEAGTFSGSFNGYGDYGQNMDATFNGTMAGTVWPEGEWEAWEFSGTTQIDAIYHAQGPGLERTEHLEIETEISGEIKCWKSQMDFNIEWNPPNKDFVLICKGCPLPVEFPSPDDLKPEELDVRLGCQPSTPSTEEQVVCTADVSGAGEDESLEFQWYLDGNSIDTTQEPTWRWRAEETGAHQIGVQVLGDDRSAEATVTVEVSEKVEVVTDTDGDGIPDDEDLCPGEAGQETDGCPAFGVRLGCQPGTPAAGEAVACTADVLGAREDESFEFHWYLDSAFVETTSGPAWTWGQAEAGPHNIGLEVVGEDRATEADFTLTVGEEMGFVATIGLTPDPPVAEAALIFSANVDGQGPDETLTYQWSLDGEVMCESATCTWPAALPGAHTVQLVVYGDGRETADSRSFDVPLAVTKVPETAPARFHIVYLDCSDDISSDETLACTVRFDRDQERLGLLNVMWLLNGAVAATESSAGDSASWGLDQPAPGDHRIEVQVSDPETGQAQANSTWTTVRPGRNAMIPPTMQVGAAAGTLTALGAWLWLEWLQNRRTIAEESASQATEEAREKALEQDRQRWFREQEALNRVQQQQREIYQNTQNTLAKVWKKQYEKLLEEARVNPRIEYLVDVMDRHHADVYKNGAWDEKQLGRLIGIVDRMRAIQQDADRTQSLVALRNSLRSPALEALSETFQSNLVFGVRILTNTLTMGAAEGLWMPLSATVNALDVRSTVLLSGKHGREAGLAIFKQASKGLAADYFIGKVLSSGPKAFAPELARAKDWLKAQTPTFQKWGRWVTEKAADAAKKLRSTTPQSRPLPIIRQSPRLPTGAVERGTYVRNILRDAGVREDLVKRMGYEVGQRTKYGATSLRRGGRVFARTFDEGLVAVKSTAFHELDHLMQFEQLKTQAVKGGPLADWVDNQGHLTQRGSCLMEIDVRMQEVDRALLARDAALRKTGCTLLSPLDEWSSEAKAWHREIIAGRKAIDKLSSSSKWGEAGTVSFGNTMAKQAPGPVHAGMEFQHSIPSGLQPEGSQVWWIDDLDEMAREHGLDAHMPVVDKQFYYADGTWKPVSVAWSATTPGQYLRKFNIALDPQLTPKTQQMLRLLGYDPTNLNPWRRDVLLCIPSEHVSEVRRLIAEKISRDGFIGYEDFVKAMRAQRPSISDSELLESLMNKVVGWKEKG